MGVNFLEKAIITPYTETNPTVKQTAIGRHQELANLLCKKICKQLEIPFI